MHNRRFWNLNAAGTLMFAVLFGEIFVVTLFLEKARGASAFMAGIQMLPIMGVFAFVNYYAGRASAVWSNRRTMIIGYGTAAMGAASTILVGGATPYWLLAITLVICNLGLGFSGPRKGSHHGRGGEAGRRPTALTVAARPHRRARPIRVPNQSDDIGSAIDVLFDTDSPRFWQPAVSTCPAPDTAE